jgi:outer membrane lipoprotein carrier protein
MAIVLLAFSLFVGFPLSNADAKTHKKKSHATSKTQKKTTRKKAKAAPAKPMSKEVQAILKQIEDKYGAPSFSAHFTQESPLPEIQVTETAEGDVYFKKPGKFRWEYKKPEILNYISNGETLWIYSPEDNNVWLGKSRDFFGKGSSANVLTDVKQIRNQFTVTLAESKDEDTSRIKLVPKSKSIGFTDIFLTIDTHSHEITKIVSFNMNGEETRITLSNLKFQALNDDTQFNFTVPKNANIIPLE